MAKRHTFRKTKSSKPIPVTARELESFMLEHKGKFSSREYDTWYNFSLAYIPRALNNRNANDAIFQMFFIGKWKVDKLSLWAEPEDIVHYGHDPNNTFC